MWLGLPELLTPENTQLGSLISRTTAPSGWTIFVNEGVSGSSFRYSRRWAWTYWILTFSRSALERVFRASIVVRSFIASKNGVDQCAEWRAISESFPDLIRSTSALPVSGLISPWRWWPH